MQNQQTIKVLWIDYSQKSDVYKEMQKLTRVYFKGTDITFVKSDRRLYEIQKDKKLGGFDVCITHLSNIGVDGFLDAYRDEMLDMRVGVLTNEMLGWIAGDIMKRFSADFLSNFDDSEFIKDQIKKGRVLPDEVNKRGKEILLSTTNRPISEGRIVRSEREDW